MTPHVEVAILGAGTAGLSAALTLGRSRRTALVYDSGAPRNAPSHAAHNMFTRDGTPPLELLRIGREQLGAYPSVSIRSAGVRAVSKLEDGSFEVVSDDGQTTHADRIILATGVVDNLPKIKGLEALWGTGVFHCPYCHGWEVSDRPFVLIAQQIAAGHFAKILRGWSQDITVCPVSPDVIPEEQIEELKALGVVFAAPVKQLVGDERGEVQEVILEDGSTLGPAAVFTSATLRQRTSFATDLGCELLTEGMFTGLVKVDDFGLTSVEGVYAVGDMAEGLPQVISASHQGAAAAAMLNNALLIQGKLPRQGA